MSGAASPSACQRRRHHGLPPRAFFARSRLRRRACLGASKPVVARIVALASGASVLPAPAATGTQHRNAVDGARRNAKPASGAKRGEHGVHAFGCADDGIDRASVYAQRAADARRLVDAGNRERACLFETRIERGHRAGGEIRERRDQGVATGRTAVDGRARGHGLGIRTATVAAATTTLRLWQRRIDRFSERMRKLHVRLRAHATDSTVLAPR